MIRTRGGRARAGARHDRARRDRRRQVDRGAVPRGAARPAGVSGGPAARRRAHRALAAARRGAAARAPRRRARLRAGAGRRRRGAARRAGRPVYDATALARGAALATSARADRRDPLRATSGIALLLARSLATCRRSARGRLVGLFGVGAERATRRARPARAGRRRSGSRASTRCSTRCARCSRARR